MVYSLYLFRRSDKVKITVLYDFYFRELSDDLLSKLHEVAQGATVSTVQQDVVEVADLIDSDIVFGRIPPHLLIELPNLKWLHLASAGANGMTDRNLYANKSTVLTKSSGTFGIPIAEHIIGMMIALSRDFGYYYKKQAEGKWCNDFPHLLDIHGSKVFILGLGDLGTELSKHLSGFGCKMVGFRRDETKPHEIINDVRPLSKLKESLPEADYIIICTPGTTETEKLFGYEEFELMKNTAIIINVGRGMIIDSDALAEALKQGKIGGAGLDVTEPEPLPEGHPLWDAPNLLITPHVSAATQVTSERRLMVFLNLLKRYLAGQELYNFVDFDTGY